MTETDRRLAEADPRVLAGVLALLEGDPALCVLADRPDELVGRVRTALDDHGWRRSPSVSTDVALRVMRLVTAPTVGSDYLAKFRSDLGLDDEPPRQVERWDPRLDVLVIGAGLSGLAMAARLEEMGAEYTVLEKHTDVGGVWFENTYPGCGLDTHPHVYAWSFAPKNDWASFYARRSDVLGYLRDFAASRELGRRIRFGIEVRSATYDAERGRWRVEAFDSTSGEVVHLDARVLVTAVGTLNQPKTPSIPGIETFGGPVFHTARWRHDVDLEGKRIALVGNGSSGVQVAPALADLGRLTVFQRSPAWMKPRRVSAAAEKVGPELHWLLDQVPYYAELYRFALYWQYGDSMHPYLVKDPGWTGRGTNAKNEALRTDLETYIREQTGDDVELAAKVTPDYPPYVKRMVVDSGWYRTVGRPDVELVTERIVGATHDGLRTADGRHHQVDVVVMGTGFQGARFLYPMDVRGRGGRTPGEIAGSSDDARAYLGMVMPDFPNLFSIQGPNSSIGHGGGATFVGETQSHYIAAMLRRMNAEGIAEVECRQDTCDTYNAELDKAIDRMVWTEEGVDSRYKNSEGRIVANHPWTLQQYWNMTREPDLGDYVVRVGR